MLPEKHEEILNEVFEEIEVALKDRRGLVSHQRRLAFILSLGTTTLIELYLHKQNISKPGIKINHLWFKKKKSTILEQIQHQVISPLNLIAHFEDALDLAAKIEEKRDELAYGSPSSEKILQEKIKLFFELRQLLK